MFNNKKGQVIFRFLLFGIGIAVVLTAVVFLLLWFIGWVFGIEFYSLTKIAEWRRKQKEKYYDSIVKQKTKEEYNEKEKPRKR